LAIIHLWSCQNPYAIEPLLDFTEDAVSNPGYAAKAPRDSLLPARELGGHRLNDRSVSRYLKIVDGADISVS
jgi:hypothetical protein